MVTHSKVKDFDIAQIRYDLAHVRNFWPWHALQFARCEYRLGLTPQTSFYAIFITIVLKALLHYATCVATCLAILLRHKLQAKLQGVTCLAIIKSRNIFVARSIGRSRIRFYFS